MSGRPVFITNEDLDRWSEIIDNDPYVSPGFAQNPIIREVCYAGQWLTEKLTSLNCPDNIITRIIYTAGKISFGREPWTVHQNILEKFIEGKLDFEIDTGDLN